MLKDTQRRKWIIVAVIAFALTGLFLSGVMLGSQPANKIAFYVLIVLAWGCAGGFVWWFLLHRNAKIRVQNGIAAGVIASLISIPLFWLMFTVIAWMTDIEVELHFDALNLTNVLLFWPVATLVTWLVIGWIAVVLGGVVGGLLGYFERRPQESAAEPHRLNHVLRAAGVTFSTVALALFVLGIVPVDTSTLVSKSNAAMDYGDGIQRLNVIREQESREPLLEECRTQWMTHGKRAEKVIVFYHGLTNCPEQFRPLGKQFFDRGYNVVLARHPYHVYQDRDVSHLASLTPFAYRDMADASIDAAHGLGEKVYVVGLSGGGTVASWIAQNRADVERTLIIAPFYGTGLIPPLINRFGVGLLTRIPNINLPGVDNISYAYPGNTTRGWGETMWLGEAVKRQAEAGPPASQNLAVMLNDNDSVVNNRMTRDLIDAWKRAGLAPEIYVLPKSLGLEHDIIDVHQKVKNPELIYAAVIDIIESRKPLF